MTSKPTWFAIAALLTLILGRYAWEQHRLRAGYEAWQRTGQRAPPPPAVSGNAGEAHDR